MYDEKNKPKTLDRGIQKAFYPTGSNASRFYGTAKEHKIDRNDRVDRLLLCPIVSSSGSASYQLAK